MDALTPTTQRPTESRDRSNPSRVTGKLRQAIEAMVWEGTKRDDAARAVGMLPKSLYNAFRKHHVKAFYLAELEVLRTSARSRAHHRMIALSEQDDNKAAAVTATRCLMGEQEQALAANTNRQAAGITIVFETREAPKTIDITPTTGEGEL